MSDIVKVYLTRDDLCTLMKLVMVEIDRLKKVYSNCYSSPYNRARIRKLDQIETDLTSSLELHVKSLAAEAVKKIN